MKSRFTAALLVLASCAVFSATTCRAESLVAVSSQDGTVKLYAPTRDVLKPVKSIPAGRKPGEMCLDPAGTHLYVGEVPEKQFAVIDLQSKAIVSTFSDPGIESPDGCAVSPDGKNLWVVDKVADTVFIFDIGSHQLIRKIAVGKEPRRALFTRDGKSVIISSASDDELMVIDPATGKVVRTIKSGHGPQDMAWTPDGKFLVVGFVDDDAVGYYNPDTLELQQEVGTVQSPQRVVPSLDSQFVFVSGHFKSEVGVMNLRPNSRLWGRIVQTISVGTQTQWGLTMSSDGKYLYSTQPGDDTVDVIDISLMKAVLKVRVKQPGAILYCK